jgi:predicted HicB family RNase H-like nuclease
MKEMRYEGYIGSVEVSEADDCLFGKLLHISDLVTYEAETPGKLREAFVDAITDYLADCAELEKEPDTPFKGAFNVRTKPSTHRKVAITANMLGKKLNTFANDALMLATTVIEQTHVDASKVTASFLMVTYDAEAGEFVVKRRAGDVSGKKVAAKEKAVVRSKAKAKSKHPVHRRTV